MPTNPITVEKRSRRWQEQRWLLDNVIRTVGVEWDQNRISYVMAPCGLGALPDFTAVRNNIKKFNDIAREYGRAAAKREKRAQEAERSGDLVSARESYFIAAQLYGAAQWPIFANTPENITYNERKVACYSQYACYADHPVRRVEIPFGDQSLPAWLHLPKEGESPSPWPCILYTQGMDAFKEMLVAQYGDVYLERGIAVLAFDGPGQGECTVRDIHVTGTNFEEAGRAAFAWLRSQPEIDLHRIGVSAQSMGSLWATQMASVDDQLTGCAVAYVGHEPGVHTAFELASTTFKLRFMYMAGYKSEEEFDRFVSTINGLAEGIGAKLSCPYLCVAGEDDDFSALEYTYDLLNTLRTPKTLVLYQGERHSLHTAAASANGPQELVRIAQWHRDRFDGKPARSEHIFITSAGQVCIEPWGDQPRHYEFASTQG